MLQSITEYISTHGSQILFQTGTHVGISLFALFVSAMIGIPFGYLASGSDRAGSLVSAPFEILRVVPSLALLILLMPIMGTGVVPAVTALTVLAIPPVLLNTMAGFQSVPDYMIESAMGIGMTEREILCKVRIPAALPMIIAGLKTALVEVFASTTLAAKIGAGGLGEIIFTGLGLNRTDLLVLGGALVALLSLLAGALFDLITRQFLKYKYK